MFKKTLLSLCITLSFSGGVMAAAGTDKVVNDYDCTVQELQSYMGKKTEGLVQRKSPLPVFEEFVKNKTTRTSAGQAGGAAPKGAEEEDCNYFWGDLEKVKIEKPEDGSIIGDILSGDISAILTKSKERVLDIATGMAEEIQKGICKRLSTDNVMDTVTDYGDGVLEEATGGYDSGDITDPDLNGMINGGLKGSYGNVGKLINPFDPSADKKRSSAILKETDHQIESMIKF
jgi:hypothetical protein